MRLWSDKVRMRQLARLKKLRTLQFDECRSAGRLAWAEAKRIQANLPLTWQDEKGEPHPVRVDIPSPDVFALVLGVFRAGATLKSGKSEGKILRLELSAGDIARLIRRSKSTVEAALRFLDCSRIVYKGADYGRALGILHRCRRYGPAFLDGERRFVHRTSSIVLTLVGRLHLRLPYRADERRVEQRQAKACAPRQPPAAAPRAPTADATAAALRAQQAAIDDEGPEARAAAAAARARIHRQLNLV